MVGVAWGVGPAGAERARGGPAGMDLSSERDVIAARADLQVCC